METKRMRELARTAEKESMDELVRLVSFESLANPFPVREPHQPLHGYGVSESGDRYLFLAADTTTGYEVVDAPDSFAPEHVLDHDYEVHEAQPVWSEIQSDRPIPEYCCTDETHKEIIELLQEKFVADRVGWVAFLDGPQSLKTSNSDYLDSVVAIASENQTLYYIVDGDDGLELRIAVDNDPWAIGVVAAHCKEWVAFPLFDMFFSATTVR